ncbi:MAG: TetR/AcrR family transcriptional regulator [Acidimicrobiales bacterium]|nr:TetR/AcrR family transcriptional regulator [Acidimicrobiales bacterium]
MSARAVDGRTARRERNRQEVVEAALTLVDEGEADPSIEQLTKRSGLSARSIFRYFDGLDDLRREVMRRHFDRVEPLGEIPDPGQGRFDQRVKSFVETRIRLNEAMAGQARTARLRAPYSSVIANDIREYRGVLDAQVRKHFAPELKGRSRAEADDLVTVVDVLMSFDGWDLLVSEHSRSRPQVRRAWTQALTNLFGRGTP